MHTKILCGDLLIMAVIKIFKLKCKIIIINNWFAFYVMNIPHYSSEITSSKYDNPQHLSEW